METNELFARRNALKNWHERMAECKNLDVLKFQPSDLLIVGPPKSGTTWLQQIFHQIRMHGDENFTDICDVTKCCPMYIPSFPGYQIDGPQVGTPRIFKGHGSYEAIPKVEGMQFAVILRDPFDTVWSYVKFATRFYGVDRDLTCEELTNVYSNSSFGVLSPWQFILNWIPHKSDSNVLWLHYEDLVKNLSLCIEKCAEFIGVKLKEDELKRICTFCSFDYMSSHKEKFSGGELLDALMTLSQHSGDIWQSQMGMVRTDGGQVGQGEKLMPTAMKAFVYDSWKNSVEKSLNFASYQKFYETYSILK